MKTSFSDALNIPYFKYLGYDVTYDEDGFAGIRPNGLHGPHFNTLDEAWRDNIIHYDNVDESPTEDRSLTPEEERAIERAYDHFVSGEELPGYRCNRCNERVNMVKMKCGCTKSPSPWELINKKPTC